MAQETNVRRTLNDPIDVQETICDGAIKVVIHGSLGTLIFTHVRPSAVPLFERGELETEATVRARIVLTVENIVALRDLLNQMLKDPQAASGTTTGAKRH